MQSRCPILTNFLFKNTFSDIKRKVVFSVVFFFYDFDTNNNRLKSDTCRIDVHAVCF